MGKHVDRVVVEGFLLPLTSQVTVAETRTTRKDGAKDAAVVGWKTAWHPW